MFIWALQISKIDISNFNTKFFMNSASSIYKSIFLHTSESFYKS